MSLSVLPRKAARGWLARLGTERRESTDERVLYDASLVIAEADVPGALQALVAHHPHLRRFGRRLGGAADHDRLGMRRNLIDALQLLNHDATRSVTDLGVRILGGSGPGSRVEGVLSAIAPFVRAGSFAEARCGADRWIWHFDGAVCRRSADQVDVRMTGHAAVPGVTH